MVKQNPNQSPIFENIENPIIVGGIVGGEEQAALQGIEIAKRYLEDPDSFGADWPSVQIAKKHRSDAAGGSQPSVIIDTTPANYGGQGRSRAAQEEQRRADQAFLRSQQRYGRGPKR